MLIAILASAAFLAPSATPAQTVDRWIADKTEASATLPLPEDSSGLSAAALSCAAQRWVLRLDSKEATAPTDGPAILSVDGRTFDSEFVAERSGLTLAVPGEAIEPLKSGLRLEIDLADALEEVAGVLVFSLKGSRVAISAAEQRCTLRDMTGYTPVTFTPFSSYMNLARELRADDITAFSVSTASQPDIAVAMLEVGEGKRLLFTRLCGSSWYFGSSGCNITGYAPDSGETGWRAVYDTENVHLYTDPRSLSDGWPDIATLPVGAGAAARLWQWNGLAYAFSGDLPEDP